MKWKAEYAIGIEAIDAQHKTIFEHLLALENSMVKKDSKDIQRFFHTQLADYLKFHFAVEEAMLDALRYPDMKDHLARHGRLGERMRELEMAALRSGSANELVHFFEDWFVGHVLADDRQYADYVLRLTGAR